MMDVQIDIAVAHSRVAKKWKNRKMSWTDLVNICRDTKRTGETVAEYARMSRDEQGVIKDIGGFVGGYLTGGTRKTANVAYRSVATLDLDYATPDVWDDFTSMFSFAAMIYSTHKHTPEKPRYRLVLPFSRKVKPDEYEPVCRRLAEIIGIDMFDTTTYQLARLFYWPSTSKDGEYYFQSQDGALCDVDAILASYHDYHDVSSWPVSNREGELLVHEMKKAGDPLDKPGLIGAFCRCYTIEDVIEAFLGDVYESTALPGRYTYTKGHVAGGLVCYDHKFAYSHHDTDPASRQLCNAFDLCRIHLFGEYDEGSRETDITKRPSYLKMQDYAAADRNVRLLLARERLAGAVEDFGGVDTTDGGDEGTGDEPDTDWMADLDYDKKGTIKSTAANIIAILEHDPKLAGHIWHDLFSGFDLVRGGLPWDAKATQWGNRDDANLRIYMEENYGVTGKDRIKDAKDAVVTRHQVHPIREYLKGLQWDGVPRLETLIIDYIGAEDTLLNRAMTRKHFVAAVARVMNPGSKYDYCLIVTGPEGIGKSTLFNVMGGDWFSDSLVTMEGKTGMEQARGGWIIELPELGSIKRSDVESVKAFISRREDIFRPAYGAVVEKHPRQCVFCGTTNEALFLKGDTGNRRFWVIQADPDKRKQGGTREDLEKARDQLWAEAVEYWKRGEQLFLPDDLETEARKKQAEYNDDVDDPVRDLLESFLDMKLPGEWNTWDLRRRRAYISNPDPLDAIGTETRERICIPEFICERMNRDMGDKEYKYLARKVGRLLDDMPGWTRIGSSKHAIRLYGLQRSWRRVLPNEDTGEDDI